MELLAVTGHAFVMFACSYLLSGVNIGRIKEDIIKKNNKNNHKITVKQS